MRVSRTRPFVAVGLAAAILTGGPASAHHSYAMFDSAKSVKLEGVVREFQWTNPHSFIQLLVKDATGKEIEYSIEASSPNALFRYGWNRLSLKAGDKAVVTMHPLRSGEPGGSLVDVVANGKPVGRSSIPRS